MDSEGDEEYFQVGEAAAFLHVSRQTLSRWAREGRVPCQLTMGGHRRFARSVLEQLRNELQVGSEDPRSP